MVKYAFWNNKGGTGKTSLAFQTITTYASKNKEKKILVIDLCPQANLSELLLGGLVGNGSNNLMSLFGEERISVGGYFQDRLPSPFSIPEIDVIKYIVEPYKFNGSINPNISLLSGDPIVELQTNAIATLANTQIPGTDTWIKVIDWINDFICKTGDTYDIVFIDCNPSFSIYTQIALASVDKLIVPVMADDSSRRALQNVFTLVYGLKIPSKIYHEYTFSTKINGSKRKLPKIHAIVKNRLTQYMWQASSAYQSVLRSIDQDIINLKAEYPDIFEFEDYESGIIEIRDFQTPGVVAFAEGVPFDALTTGKHSIMGQDTTINSLQRENCIEAINGLVKII